MVEGLRVSIGVCMSSDCITGMKGIIGSRSKLHRTTELNRRVDFS